MKTWIDVIYLYTIWPYRYLWWYFREKIKNIGPAELDDNPVLLAVAFTVFVHFLLALISLLVYLLIK